MRPVSWIWLSRIAPGAIIDKTFSGRFPMNRVKVSQHACGIIISLVLAGSAHAEDWKVTGSFGWLGVGKVYQIEKGNLYFVGEFSGTFFNDKGKNSLFDQAGVKGPAFNDLDLKQRQSRWLLHYQWCLR
jgi:hypothetical protein